MTDTERSLLDAVLENPDDDLPRLVYADYLDENGDPKRAEFIRAQITLSKSENRIHYDSDEFTSAIKTIIKLKPVDYYKWILHDNFDYSHVAEMTTIDNRVDRIIIRHTKYGNTFHFHRGFLVSSILRTNSGSITDILGLHPVNSLRVTTIPNFIFDFHITKENGNWHTLAKVNDDEQQYQSDWHERRQLANGFMSWVAGFLDQAIYPSRESS